MATTTDIYPGRPYTEVEGNYLTHEKGILSWLTTVDHKRIGVMYLMCISTAFLFGGLFAMVIRWELFAPGATVPGLNADRYNQIFTLHGAIMVFLVIIPGIPAALGNFVLPMMLGAKDVAFPRLNLMSWYLWVVGALFAVISMVTSAADTGWTFYTPYSTTTQTAVIPMVVGAFILGFSSIFTGLNFIVTIHKMRPEGLTWFKLPLFLWSIYATAIIQVIATPVLGITLLLLIAERVMGVGIFDSTYGGDPVLFQHFFWFYSHPAVYIMILPAMGVISEMIPVFSRKHIFGYTAIAYSSVAIAMFSFIVWGHHMFTSMSPLSNMIFSAVTFSVSIPSAVKVFNWTATLYKGSIRLATPMCYALAFLFLFTIGGLTGLHLATLGTDIHLHDTYFVVAHFHYVMVGSTMIAFLGGLHYWWPKIFGKMYSETYGRLGCLTTFIGFNVTFLPQFVLGTRGMPRRYYDYLPEFQTLHAVSSIGAFIMGAGLFITLFCLLHSLKWGKPAADNPWGSAALEWQSTSPPHYHNFTKEPTVGDPYDYQDFKWDPKAEGYYKTAEGQGAA